MDQEKKTSRISSIDMLRGLVMLIMLVDHVRERFFSHNVITDPLTIHEISSSLFFTRLSAHLCAPIFVFLTGLSAWLYSNPQNKPPRSATSFLLKRGLFLVLLEITLINFSWFGAYHTLYLQVIWAIGISMICLAGVSRLPRIWIGIMGVLIVFGHNALSFISFEPTEIGYSLWTILHDRGYLINNSIISIKASYPVLPWIGVILLGYFSGPLYAKSMIAAKRQKILIIACISSLTTLLILRGFNIYGETLAWQVQESFLKSVMSFLNYTKYPPSLDYLLFTLGIGCLLLYCFERVNYKWLHIAKTYGSAPMFFYIIHLYVLLVLYKISMLVFGPNQGDVFGVNYVYELWLISMILSAILYFPTKMFSDYKRKSSSKLIKYF
ncbi:DUF1624 domain-containing protein [Aquimarina sp. RZ0]|uniref:DUF1624 domain-containing protein n=1 Tax=Aquimarina sp. RZ0 TaxID=2607730 RepID=UPI0011F38214|nr:heparan-alpha-glucosaminide N-acetyltransferase domain-containing protein [Aquimarina sp. RZ0]KAA1246844.1 DUF1624 domain-containing protein [Aquimarina sp. RZ0]